MFLYCYFCAEPGPKSEACDGGTLEYVCYHCIAEMSVKFLEEAGIN